MSSEKSSLQHRLLSCLQTIVEMEEVLRSVDEDNNLVQEFYILKKVINKIHELDINENDVHRVERATTNFLSELSGSLKEIISRKREDIQLH